MTIDGNRYSVPFSLIGKTVQIVREGGHWIIRLAGRIVAEHAVVAVRGQCCIRPEHGPGAAARNARLPRPPAPSHDADALERLLRATSDVEIRDLALYDQLAGAAAQVASKRNRRRFLFKVRSEWRIFGTRLP